MYILTGNKLQTSLDRLFVGTELLKIHIIEPETRFIIPLSIPSLHRNRNWMSGTESSNTTVDIMLR